MEANVWKKGSRSNGSGGNNCVEVQWKTSGECADSACVEIGVQMNKCATGTCVEVGFQKANGCGTSTCVEVKKPQGEEERVLVRDSKDKGGPVLSFTRDEWIAFIAGAKAGEFDL